MKIPDIIMTVSTIEVSGTELEVCRDIAERQQKGIKKYGVTVRENPLTLARWLQHAYEECLDQAVYLKRAMEEIGKTEPQPIPAELAQDQSDRQEAKLREREEKEEQ
jgi:hypothetical protein